MLIKIAWRNLWRNSRRSLIILTSIVIGIIVTVLNDSLGVGMMNQMLDNQIMSYSSHIKIHKKGFNNDKILKNYIPDPENIVETLNNNPKIKLFGKRITTLGLINSANNSAGIMLLGVEPDKERSLSYIKKYLTRGKFLTGASHEILIGQKMADKLEVDIGDKLVIIAADLHGATQTELFKVTGIYKSSSSEFDKMNVYVSLADAQRMLELKNGITEISMLLNKPEESGLIKKGLLKSLPDGYEVLTYQELLPLIMSYLEIYDQAIYIFYLITAFAVLFGIINTMLMSVFERIHEIGVIMSIGMKNSKIFLMFILEAFVLGFLGTLVGFILSFIIIIPLMSHGIDLSIFSESLNAYGFGSVIYPEFQMHIVVYSFLIMPLAAAFGAVYPSIKAIRLHPTEAMRYV